jgi:hypothetical protein
MGSYYIYLIVYIVSSYLYLYMKLLEELMSKYPFLFLRPRRTATTERPPHHTLVSHKHFSKSEHPIESADRESSCWTCLKVFPCALCSYGLCSLSSTLSFGITWVWIREDARLLSGPPYLPVGVTVTVWCITSVRATLMVTRPHQHLQHFHHLGWLQRHRPTYLTLLVLMRLIPITLES